MFQPTIDSSRTPVNQLVGGPFSVGVHLWQELSRMFEASAVSFQGIVTIIPSYILNLYFPIICYWFLAIIALFILVRSLVQPGVKWCNEDEGLQSISAHCEVCNKAMLYTEWQVPLGGWLLGLAHQILVDLAASNNCDTRNSWVYATIRSWPL